MTGLTKSENKSGVMNNLWKQEFKFVSPMPIDECARSLADKNERKNGLFANQHKLVVKITPDVTGGYRFKLHRDAGRNLHVVTQGTLSRWEEGATLVSGSSQVGTITVLVFCLVLLIVVPIAMSGAFADSFGLLFVLSFIVMFAFLAVERNRMTKIIYNTLSDQIY